MKKILIFGAILTIVSVNMSLAHNPEGVFVIHMNKDGFSPSQITIPKGSTVVFENIDNRDRWPASNIHPTHSIYIEFDPEKPVLSGAEWQFKFDRVGRWKFHDHIYPNMVGTVIVENKEDSSENESESKISLLSKFFGFIKNIINRFQDMLLRSKDKSASIIIPEGTDLQTIINDKDMLLTYLEETGIESVMKRLVKESGGGSVYDCHQQSHNIGRIGYEVAGEKAFQECDASCHSGCYHGAMESFLNKAGTEDLARDIDRICKKFNTFFGSFECLHGVGHGVLAYLNYDLPEALKECKKLNGTFSQTSCYGGLFMENILTGQGLGANTQDHKTDWVNQTDPYFPCNSIDQDPPLQYQCYQMQTSWMLTMTGYNFDKVAKYCLSTPIPEMVPVCMKSYGRDVAGHTLRNPEKIVELCKKIPKANGYYNECILGAENVIIDFWGPGLQGQASELCKVTSEPMKQLCYKNIQERLPTIFRTTKEQVAICQTFEDPYKESCLKSYSSR